MAFAIMRIEIGEFGESVNREGLQPGLESRDAAMEQAAEWAKQQEIHGYNEEHGLYPLRWDS